MVVDGKEIFEGLSEYRTPDGRKLYGLYRAGYRSCGGFSRFGSRTPEHIICGTKIKAQGKYHHMGSPVVTKTLFPLPISILKRVSKHFHEWLKEQPWFSSDIRTSVSDDRHNQRLEFKLYW